jgi:acetyl esterase/lipase
MKIFKRTFAGILVIIGIFILLMLIPRTIAWIFPEKPPVGYYFMWADLLAVGVGLESAINQFPEVPAGIEHLKDIEYKNVEGKSLQLDIFRPDNLEKPAPLLVFIHGGSWKGGKRLDYQMYLVDFAKRGYVTATVSYRLIRDACYPASAEDVTDAIDWLHEHGGEYGYDPSRMAVIGGSAGGHLALLAAYGWKQGSEGKVKAVVDIYGPADLTTEYARNHRLVTDFLAGKYEDSPELFRHASPVTYAGSNSPPTLILQGSADRLVPASQSDSLHKKLIDLGVPCEYHRLPGWPHTMDIVQRVNDYCQLKMTAFFSAYL